MDHKDKEIKRLRREKRAISLGLGLGLGISGGIMTLLFLIFAIRTRGFTQAASK